MRYRFYDANNVIVMETQWPIFEDYDPVCQSFFVVNEDKARAILIRRDDVEGFEDYHANIEGREPFSWVQKTVRMEKVQ